MTVAELKPFIKQNIRIEKHNKVGKMIGYDINDYLSQEVKEIRTFSDGGSYWVLIVI